MKHAIQAIYLGISIRYESVHFSQYRVKCFPCRCRRTGCPPQKLSAEHVVLGPAAPPGHSVSFRSRSRSRSRSPVSVSVRSRSAGPRGGLLVLGPHIPLGQLVLGSGVPFRTSCPPHCIMRRRLYSIVLSSAAVLLKGTSVLKGGTDGGVVGL